MMKNGMLELFSDRQSRHRRKVWKWLVKELTRGLGQKSEAFLYPLCSHRGGSACACL